MTMITDQEIIFRLFLTTLLSALIGIEREFYRKPAGLRTNVVVGLGSALMTIASVKVVELMPPGSQVDPARISAQIVTGIGFIGAGAILRPVGGTNFNVIGLTTAATLWVVAGLGIAVGMGFYLAAIATTALVFFTFLVLGRVVNRMREYTKLHPPKMSGDDEDMRKENGGEN
jgi:putative Mg2+ transporter-C (MgtC) family protein